MNKKGMPANKMTGFRMVGGIDIDVEQMKTLPDAKYWAMGARWAKDKIYDFAKDQEAELRISDVLEKFYNESNTWLYICLRSERMLDLMKALIKDEK